MKTRSPLSTFSRLGPLAALSMVGLFAAEPYAPTGSAAVPATPPMKSQVFDWEKLAVKTTPNGQRRDVLDGRTATLNQLECHVTSLLPGRAAHAPHRHPWEEIILVKEGTLEVNLNGELSRVGPGSVLFYAPNDLHGVRNVGDTLASYHVLIWKSRDTQPGRSVSEPAPTVAPKG